MKKCYIIPKETCSCDCTFCISKSRDYQNKLKPNKEEPFLESAEDILITLRLRGVKLFEITGGGEPFLDKKLADKVARIRKIIPDAYIKIYTNGNHLDFIPGIDEINISVAHYDDEINKNIMKPKVYVPLKDKLIFFRTNYPNTKIRLSVPLLKEGMSSEEDIRKLIALTEKFDVDYVIRTIYPNTPNYKDSYTDVEFVHPKIKYEKDNDVSEFDEVIWWSNEALYGNWLLQRRKHLFSYLLLKPDARTYADEILSLVEQKGFNYYARIYQDINEIMYLYRDKPEDYQNIIRNHLKVLSVLFGPEFMLVYLNMIDKPMSIEECVLSASDLKSEIRNKYSFTHSHEGTINYKESSVHANLVHSPDLAGIKLDEDLDFLDSLPYKNTDQNMLKLIRKHGTFRV